MPLVFKTLPNFALQHPQEAGIGAKNVSDANIVTLSPLKGSFIRLNCALVSASTYQQTSLMCFVWVPVRVP